MPYGGPNRQMRGWSKKKLEYLQSYLKSYVLATKTVLERHYIDAFAGPGRLPDEETNEMVDGSPIVALRMDPQFTRCHLIEADPNTFVSLQREVSAFGHARLHHGDCNALIPGILQSIHRRSPLIAVLDPTAVIGQVAWSTVQLISQWRSEVMINFPYHMAVQRLLPTRHDEMSEDRRHELSIYLPEGWERVYDECAGAKRRHLAQRLLELYRDALKALGYTHVFATDAFRTETGVPLYYLYWAGRNETGAKIARHVFLKQFVVQGSLLGDDSSQWQERRPR